VGAGRNLLPLRSIGLSDAGLAPQLSDTLCPPSGYPTRLPAGVPTPQITAPSHTAQVQDAWQRFLDGYHAGGGRLDWIDAWYATIYGGTGHCPNGESGGNPYAVSPLGHKGLLQWADGTWAGVAAQTGYWDVWSPFDNGFNAAWMTQNDAPAQHWSCWP